MTRQYIYPAFLGGEQCQRIPLAEPLPRFIARPLCRVKNADGSYVHRPHDGSADGHGLVLAWIRRVGREVSDYAEVRLASGVVQTFNIAWLHPAGNVADLRPRQPNAMRRSA